MRVARGARATALAVGLLAAWPAAALAGGGPVVTLAAQVNAGGAAVTTSLACPTVGSCVAGGFYTDASGNHQAFIAQQVDGNWGTVVRLAGALNLGGNASATDISCPGLGSCVAVGFYTDVADQHQAFLVEETDGVWGSTQTTAGVLNAGGDAVATTVSCAAAGSCVVGGRYRDAAGTQRAFAALETGGAWGEAAQVGGVAASGDNASVTASACPAVGACVVGGSVAAGGNTVAFVDAEHNDLWGKPVDPVPTSVASSSAIAALACASAQSCAAVGSASTASGRRAVAVLETNGTWGAPSVVAGPGRSAGPTSGTAVACPAPSTCTLVGTVSSSTGATSAFVASETAGTWTPSHTLAPVAGVAGLVVTDEAPWAVACPSIGSCVATGQLTLAVGGPAAFVARQQSGHWGRALLVAQGDNVGRDAASFILACDGTGACEIGGRYTDASRHFQSFVATAPAFEPVIVVTGVHGTVPASGAANVVIAGSGFFGAVRVRAAGLVLRVVAVAPTRLVLRVVRSHVAPGRHLLTVVDPDGSSAVTSFVQR